MADKISETGKKKEYLFAFGAVFLFWLFVVGILFVALPKNDPSVIQLTDSLDRFESYDSLVAEFRAAQNYDYYGGIENIGLPMLTTGVSKSVSDSSTTTGSSDYSKTNIQVEGVDEADIIKTDGAYAYAVSQNKFFIISVYPTEEAEIISEVEFEQGTNPIELFINKDKVIIFTQGYNQSSYAEKPSTTCVSGTDCAMPYDGFGYQTSIFAAQVYDVSDKENPKLLKEVELEGSYLSSRMIQNDVYFVVNSYPNYYSSGTDSNEGIIPLMRVDGKNTTNIAEATDIGIIPNVRPSAFVTILSINLDSLKIEKEVVAASGQTIYASQENLYLVDQVWYNDAFPVPLPLPLEILKSVYTQSWNVTEKTAVSKFSLNEGKISFVAQGTVPGYTLNQFSMDEYDNHFRIATTTGHVSQQGGGSSNNIYILGKDMQVRGILEDLAPGEKIYSARFMGERGYLVTFKKVDPLFVIDLKNPTNPKVLGKLKIPGYSDYLHPIDETHLIGLGKDTIESSYGDFAWYQGIKMAIFDVTDVENPKEMYKTIIGDRGTDSYALHDHKAFLFDKEKELLVIPITLAEIPEEQKIDAESISSPQYGEYTFQGAFVFNVSLENGITERGRITHVTSEQELQRGYYYGDESLVKRAFYVDDALFTFSNSMLKVNNLSSLEEITQVDLPVIQSNYYGGYYK